MQAMCVYITATAVYIISVCANIEEGMHTRAFDMMDRCLITS